MFNKIARRFFLVLLGLFFLSGGNCGQNDPNASHPSLGPPTAAYGTTGNANGSPSAQAASMNGTASVLANMISEYRANAGLPTVSANDVLTGVAQVQADDMAASNAVGLVGTDGEDAFQRLANSGYANATVAVIAAGYSTDPTAVYDAMVMDNGANQALLLGNSSFSSIGVGYSNGYWMVILGNAGTGTSTGSGPTGSGPTTTIVNSATASSSSSAQQVTLSANVTSTGGTVNGGTVTFSVVDSNKNPVGTSAVSGSVSTGACSASWTLPANTPDGTYTISAAYSGSGGFLSSNGSNTLTVGAAGSNVASEITINSTAGWSANFSAGGTPGSPGSGSFTQPGTTGTPTNYMKLVSGPGDFIGGGQTYDYTSGITSQIDTTGTPLLQVADYSSAIRYPFNGSSAGLNFDGMGRGCNTLTGEFVIWQLVISNGQIVSLAVDFIQHCEGGSSALTGSIRINSSYQ